MRAKRVIPTLLGTGLVVGLGIALAVEHKARVKLRGEHDALLQQADYLARLSTENLQLSNLLAQASLLESDTNVPSHELLRLRGEVGVLRQQTKNLVSVRNENRQFRAALANSLKIQDPGIASADYWPRDSWGFAGYSSPDAALQTLIWASSTGDLKVLLAGATGQVRQMIEKDFEGKPENEASIRAMDQVVGLKSIRVLNRDVQGVDTVVLTAAFEDGTDIHTENLLMKKIGDDWKLSGPPNE